VPMKPRPWLDLDTCHERGVSRLLMLLPIALFRFPHTAGFCCLFLMMTFYLVIVATAHKTYNFNVLCIFNPNQLHGDRTAFNFTWASIARSRSFYACSGRSTVVRPGP
jgi:hypothetical protein